MRKRRNRTKNNSILFIKTNTSGRNGVIRGNKFNKIVKEFIINLHLDAHRFQVFFEKKTNSILLPKCLIGMFWKNQRIKLQLV